ncbi:MAG: MATE family efflux transporter [Roseiarcus sp.]|uniref:MATE family efflux transporter n=1 Tax=Roseiarcus sp. TaxID=1969460 RepID=UPI003BB1F3D8
MNALVADIVPARPATPPGPETEMSPRTLLLLRGPILTTLLVLAWPNILVMVAQASTGLIETFWVSRLGTDALAGIALVFPGFMMMTMLSAGAVGGGISSAVARALGSGRRADADALVLHAVLINLALGLLTSALFLVFGRQLYAAMGGRGGSLEAAMAYSNVVFAGNILVWLMNALASVIRATGNMAFPSTVVCIGVALLIPLSPIFIFGLGPLPGMGIAGGGVAVVATTALMAAILAWYILSGNSIVRFRIARLKAAFFADILRVGGVGSLSTLQTTLTVALTTGLVGAAAGPDAVAGYGTGSRLEYLLIPLVFGLGAPMVAMVGTNIGAGQNRRALSIAMIGAALAFVACEAIGLGAAIWPRAWLGLFGDNPVMIATGANYLRFVGPTYGFFGLGLALYFASQGAGKLAWPLLAGFARLVIAVGGGWLALAATGSESSVFVMLAVALAAYGGIIGIAVRSGVWFRNKPDAGSFS